MKELSPPKAANRLVRVAQTFHEAHGGQRFPIDIDQLALGAAEIFNWQDPITKIQQADIQNFEGALSHNEDKSKWMIIYSSKVQSAGRIRFTKAHELGHYILHRHLRDNFLCAKNDMLDWSSDKKMESEADQFASYLLMPIDDFRSQIGTEVNLDILGHCADRYGVSLTAAVLKWLSYTEQKAIAIMSKDGFINWASSSKPAVKSGAFFRTRTSTIAIPETSLTANQAVSSEPQGQRVATKTWFEHADTDAATTEMKIFSDQYDCTLSLLILPKYAEFWPPSKEETTPS